MASEKNVHVYLEAMEKDMNKIYNTNKNEAL